MSHQPVAFANYPSTLPLLIFQCTTASNKKNALNIPPLTLATKPKFTGYMIDTLCASLIQNCKSNFNISLKEDEVKDFKTATLDRV